MEEVTVIRPGVTIERVGAVVLDCKAGSYPHTTVVLCLWTQSLHQFVVWTYNESSGAVEQGDYYMTLEPAMNRFKERGW